MAKPQRKQNKVVLGIVLVLVAFLLSIGIQVGFNLSIEAMPQRPSVSFSSSGAEKLLYLFDQQRKGVDISSEIDLSEEGLLAELDGTFRYINGRFDVADFRMNALVRLYYDFGSIMPIGVQEAIKEVMLSFKYWMDQGGSDSMCYWSENHQILFATEEYLVGQMFPNDIFTVDGLTGLEHMAMAATRINAWMSQRFLYGFTEWYSNNYYPEDIGPMSNFIQFAQDEEMVNRMKMIMDIIWFDMASQSYYYNGLDETLNPRTYFVFLPSAGRAYSDNRVSDEHGNRMRSFIDFIVQGNETKHLSNSWFTSRNGFFNAFKQMIEATDLHGNPYYEVPEVIKSIFWDSSEEIVLKSSQSLYVEELEQEGLLGQDDASIMMQFGMEAFTNPPVIDNTMKYIANNKMFTNDFLNDFKLINIWPLRALGLLGMVSTTLNPSTNGVAIQRANVYTFKTSEFLMSTAQAHKAGEYADQQAISSINLSNQVSLFTTQPAKIPRRSGTPTYWTGNGRMAYSVQEKNVLIEIYNPPTKVGFMEPMIVSETTHAFFPKQLYDHVVETHLASGVIFGRVGHTYVAIRSRYALEFVPFATSNIEGNRDDMLVRGSVKNQITEDYDLVQKGPGYHYFVTEVSGTSQETFEAFIQRVLNNPLTFDATTGQIVYSSTLYNQTNTTVLQAIYGVSFHIDSQLQDLEYGRYQNKYVPNGFTARKPSVITYVYDGKSVTLNYVDNTRVVQ
ncbi:MAG: hypothetical protein U1C51_05315 [Candidatus Izemoplasmatales bacterium]|nr:hypothetical protein [bacterium]MDZ4196654.1 hypothetical protein [Candidatus Izemoplasmatales bacterium]